MLPLSWYRIDSAITRREKNMSVNNGKSRILAGITDDAEKEACKIIDEATKMAQERLTLARGKADKIRRDAQTKASSQADTTKTTILSGITVEKKRERMKMQDEILRDLLERVQISISAVQACRSHGCSHRVSHFCQVRYPLG